MIVEIVDFIKDNIWLILFTVWGLPLGDFRSKFRKIVYKTDSWLINIKPFFIKETKALFAALYPDNDEYIRIRNFYRIYLVVYFLLFLSWLILA